VHEASSSGPSWLRCDHGARFRRARPGHTTAKKTTIVTVGAVAATAAIGAVAAYPGSDWYRSLRKPRWQPPPPAYALVWTPLYVTFDPPARLAEPGSYQGQEQTQPCPDQRDHDRANPISNSCGHRRMQVRRFYVRADTKGGHTP